MRTPRVNENMDLEDYKYEWNRLIDEKDYRYFLTITFKYYTPEDEQKASINFLLYMLNRKMFGRQYQKHDAYLKGYSFKHYKEVKYRSKYYRPKINSHYHILIRNSPVFNDLSKPTIREHLFKLLPKVQTLHCKNENYLDVIRQLRQYMIKNYHTGFHIVFLFLCYTYLTSQELLSHKGVDIRDVYDQDVIEYCNLSMLKDAKHISTLSIDGII
jgi:hypothetical protein